MRPFLALTVLMLAPLVVAASEVSDLIKQLKDSDVENRRIAAKSLGESGSAAKEAVPALIVALKDPDRFVRRFAAQALEEIGPEAKSAVPTLHAMLAAGKDRKEVLDAVAKALGKIGGDPSSVTTLTATLKDTKADMDVRRQSAEVLGKLGSQAKSAIPALVGVLKLPAKKGQMPAGFNDLRTEAINALVEIATSDDKTVVDALTEISTSKDNRDRGLNRIVKDALKKIKAKK